MQTKVKIIFLTGSQEVGKDGVGDYTRRLAGELIRQGHEAAIIALNDKYVKSILNSVQLDENTSIPVLRLPNVLSWKKKIEVAGKWIDDFDPEWLSLQFVPFAFQKKGLPFGLGKRLKPLTKNRKWHIMFHEIWVGMGKHDNLKLKLWGNIQKWVLYSFSRKIKISISHTHTQLYKFQLENLGIQSKILRLFSNIPFAKFDKIEMPTNSISLSLFGTIHPKAPIKNFIEEFKSYCNSRNLTPIIRFIGRFGEEFNSWKKICKHYHIETEVTGETDSATISYKLQQSDYGISTNPYPVIEKSGTVAAMLAHNLNIITVAKDWETKFHIKVPEWTKIYKSGNFEECLVNNLYNFSVSLTDCARQFISDLCLIE